MYRYVWLFNVFSFCTFHEGHFQLAPLCFAQASTGLIVEKGCIRRDRGVGRAAEAKAPNQILGGKKEGLTGIDL